MKRALLVGAVGILAVLVSPLFDRAEVQAGSDLGEARFGLPIAFLEAETTLTPPRPVEVRWNPWEHPADMNVARFLLSCSIVLLALAVAWIAAHLVGRRLRPRLPRPSA